MGSFGVPNEPIVVSLHVSIYNFPMYRGIVDLQ